MIRVKFHDLQIWKMAIEIADELFEIADALEGKRIYCFAEQLRGSGRSMTDNFAVGSGAA